MANASRKVPEGQAIFEQKPSARMTDEEIITHYRAGTLIEEILRPSETGLKQALHAQLTKLHNERSIDLLALTATPAFDRLDQRYAFLIQEVYGNVTPYLKATTPQMLDLIRRLEQNGSRAATPRTSLRVWLKQTKARAKEVIQIARSAPDFDLEILLDALVAFGDSKTAISFSTFTDLRRRAAIAALGSIKPTGPKTTNMTLKHLASIAQSDPNEDMRFTAIYAAFDLLSLCKTQSARWVPAFVRTVTSNPSDKSREALLHSLWRHADLFEHSDVKNTLSLACDGNLADDILIGTLGNTLCQLLGGTHHDLAVENITDLLATSGKNLSFDKFRLLEHRILSLEPQRLFAITVKWFATGDHALCDTIAKLIGRAHDQRPFDASLTGFGFSGGELIVLCHKAVGYMPLAPVVSASFIIAALRAGDKSAEPALVELLLNALLINFRDTVSKYLKAIRKTDASYLSVRKALRAYGRYEKDSIIPSPIKELQPSSYRRGVVRQNQHDANRNMMKQAERQSVFFGLVHRSTILYGRKAITYTHGASKPPTSMEMKEMSAYIEMPRLHTIDPVGLEWLLLIYKSSKSK